jgi:leucyl-tRNA synthetase
LNIAFNKFIKSAEANLEALKQNLVVSDMMIYINSCYASNVLYKKHIEGFLICLSFFAPFLAEELNQIILKNDNSIIKSLWPAYDETLTVDNNINFPIQINGKLRGTLLVPTNSERDFIIDLAKKNEAINKYITSEPKKIIFVPNKILNFIL